MGNEGRWEDDEEGRVGASEDDEDDGAIGGEGIKAGVPCRPRFLQASCAGWALHRRPPMTALGWPVPATPAEAVALHISSNCPTHETPTPIGLFFLLLLTLMHHIRGYKSTSRTATARLQRRLRLLLLGFFASVSNL